jgi:hypothetical protein
MRPYVPFCHKFSHDRYEVSVLISHTLSQSVTLIIRNVTVLASTFIDVPQHLEYQTEINAQDTF